MFTIVTSFSDYPIIGSDIGYKVRYRYYVDGTIRRHWSGDKFECSKIEEKDEIL